MGRRKPSPGPPKSPKPRPNLGRFSPVPSNKVPSNKVPSNKTPQKTPVHSNRPPTPNNKSSKVRMSPLPGRKTPSSVRSASPSMARKNQAKLKNHHRFVDLWLKRKLNQLKNLKIS